MGRFAERSAWCLLVIGDHGIGDLHLLAPQARKLEGELDAKIAAYGKLCSSYETNYSGKRGEGGLATEQVVVTQEGCVCFKIKGGFHRTL